MLVSAFCDATWVSTVVVIATSVGLSLNPALILHQLSLLLRLLCGC